MLYKNILVKSLFIKTIKLFRGDVLFIFLGVVSILPFIIISIFNNPSADDFCYNCKSKELGFWNTQMSSYYGWSGRYFSTAILSIKALVSGSFLTYKVIPVILLLLFFYSVFYLFTSVFPSLKKKDYYVLTCFVVTLYLLKMPSTSEGFYWLAASVTYQLSIIFSLFFISFFINLLKTNNKKDLIFCMLFSFAIVGSNEISMLYINLLVGMVFFYKMMNRKKINHSVLILLIFLVVLSLIVVLSPGSSTRASTYLGNHKFLYSIQKTIFAIKHFFGSWLSLIILFVMIFFDYFNKNILVKTPNIFNVDPFVILVTVLSLPFIGFFPVYWSLTWVPSRVVNLIYFFSLIGLIYLAFIMFYKLQKSKVNFISYSKWVKCFLLILIGIQIIKNNNIREAYSDLLTGKAYNYDKELRARYKTIKQNNNETLILPELTHFPRTIFFEDIREDSEHWINKCYAKYFKQKKIILKQKKI